jgi:hypothetical protein
MWYYVGGDCCISFIIKVEGAVDITQVIFLYIGGSKRMDFFNNLNVVISIIVGIFGIGGYIIGIITYLRHKVASSQQQVQRQPSQRSVPQTVPKSLSKLDWMEVLWTGLEDCFRARDGGGIIAAIGILISAVFIAAFIGIASPNVGVIAIAVFGVIYFTFLLLFYVYFVGRRIEKKVEEINQPLIKSIR